MAVKFGRNFVLTVEAQQLNGVSLPDVVIAPPTVNEFNNFTLEFDIQRNNFSSNSEAVIKIYNLSTYTCGLR